VILFKVSSEELVVIVVKGLREIKNEGLDLSSLGVTPTHTEIEISARLKHISGGSFRSSVYLEASFLPLATHLNFGVLTVSL
jgi:hypothetical protein